MSLATLQSNSDRAYVDASHWDSVNEELYRYVLPYRQPSGGSMSGKGKLKYSGIFDSTAPKAAVRFAGRMESDLTPPFQKFHELKIGPGHPVNQDKDALKALNEKLEDISTLVSAVLEGGTFSLAMQEMYLDLFGGQGALLMLEDEDTILKFVAVPSVEIALREDGYGKVNGVYWKKEFKAEALAGMWPGMKLSADQKKAAKDEPTKPLVIVQATEFDQKTRKWTFTVFEDKDKHVIYEVKDMRTSPWLTPRFYKVPGEARGRGPGMMALPTVKTVNKVTELSLKAAAFSVLGVWTYRNDRVFNPKTARMIPGVMWAVSSNGGPMGDALKKHDVPGRFDISNLVVNDLRDMIKQVTFDDTLPPTNGAVRSPTEIVERLKRLSSDLSGAYARLVLEIIVPLIQRVIDVLGKRKMIADGINIDQLLLQLKVTSPISRGQHAQDISSMVQWLEIMLSVGGQEGMLLAAKIEDIFADMGKKLGISEKFIRGEADRKALLELVAKMIAASQQEQQTPSPEQAA